MIRTRVFQYGNEKEGEWPPTFGTGGSGVYHIGKDGALVEGYPVDDTPRFGEAPYIIQDSIPAFKHAAAGVWVDSKSKLRMIDKVCGTITTDKKLAPDPSWQNEQRRKRHADSKAAILKAIEQVDAGTAPLTEETRAICARENERISNLLGIDAFNIAGRKKNGRGKGKRRR